MADVASAHDVALEGSLLRPGIVVFLFFALLTPVLAQDQGLDDRTVGTIGLQVGEPAPAFKLFDQFGREQNNETLKGSAGTVILFFRSVDW